MNQYTAKSIKVLEGLEPVQNAQGCIHILKPLHTACELIDNGSDEALNGHANRLRVNCI